MLVLSRREGEKIRIGDSIVITVVRMAGDKVRIGIDAPQEMLVLRDELNTRERAVQNPVPVSAVSKETGGANETNGLPVGALAPSNLALDGAMTASIIPTVS